LIDKALLRSGRFDYIVEIGLPDVETRKQIFKIHTSKMPLNKKVDFTKLAELSEGYSGADIEGVCRETGMILIRENRVKDKIDMKDFEKAFSLIKPSVGTTEKQLIDKFKENSSFIYR
jgi:transitional endoplasmic reticulum ATPase